MLTGDIRKEFYQALLDKNTEYEGVFYVGVTTTGVISCHRVINSNGELGGYGGGITRKKWLISHEKKGKI